MARVGIVTYYRWLEIKYPYDITIAGTRCYLCLAVNRKTFYWILCPGTFVFTTASAAGRLNISISWGETFYWFDPDKPKPITDLGVLRELYHSFIVTGQVWTEYLLQLD